MWPLFPPSDATGPHDEDRFSEWPGRRTSVTAAINTAPLNANLIETLSLIMVVTSVAAVEMRRLRLSAIAYLCQALLMVALLVAFGAVNSALYWWAGTALLTKAVLTPWFLFRSLRGIDDRELKPVIGLGRR
jgi:hypothetical protein